MLDKLSVPSKITAIVADTEKRVLLYLIFMGFSISRKDAFVYLKV